jgi:hypothetical protein
MNAFHSIIIKDGILSGTANREVKQCRYMEGDQNHLSPTLPHQRKVDYRSHILYTRKRSSFQRSTSCSNWPAYSLVLKSLHAFVYSFTQAGLAYIYIYL